VSRAPMEKIQAYQRRMGWSFPWASSCGSDFNSDFGVTRTKQEWEAGAVKYNFSEQDLRPAAGQQSALDAWSESMVGTDWETYQREGPGMSAFTQEDGTIAASIRRLHRAAPPGVLDTAEPMPFGPVTAET